jgi:hypothetical protein
MNYREKYVDTMLFKDTHCVPNHEIGLWGQTLDRWEKEGFPKGVLKNCLFERGEPYFDIEPREYAPLDYILPKPLLGPVIIEEDERTMIYKDVLGITRKTLKEGRAANGDLVCMDQYLDFPVKDRDSFREMKKHYVADVKDRYPANWDELVRIYDKRNYPLALLNNGQFGLYFILRTWMGTETTSCMFFDDPDLVHEMLDFICDYFMELTHKALHEADIDYFNFSEDLSYKTGPLFSPQIFREFFLPCYKRLTAYLNDHGIKLITVDTDGNPLKLIPLFIEAGINGIWPIEAAAGMDPVMLRKEFGNALALAGGIDKRILATSRDKIENEVMRILDYMLPRGGYIPMVDHLVPPDVSFANFNYYMDLKKTALTGKY